MSTVQGPGISAGAPRRAALFFRVCLLLLGAFLVPGSVSGTEPGDEGPALVEPDEIRALAVDASNPRVIYAGTSGFGLVKSLDGGLSWHSAGRELEGQDVTAVAVHPRTSQVVYAGTAASGLWLSITAAVTFEESSAGLPAPQITDVVIDPEFPRLVYAGTAVGLARSFDAGRRWQAVGKRHRVRDLELGGSVQRRDERNPSQRPGSPRRHSELWVLADDGLWLAGAFGERPELRLTPERMQLLARASEAGATEEEEGGAEADRGESEGAITGDLATDGGVERVSEEERAGIETSVTAEEGEVDRRRVGPLSSHERLVVQVAPSDPRVIYLGSSRLGLFRSRDGGLTWEHLSRLGSVRSLAVDPRFADHLWAGTDRGIWRSYDGGASFEPVEQGGELPVDVLVIDRRFPERVYAAVPGGRVLIRGDDGGWSLVGLRAGQLTLGDLPPPSTDSLQRLPARSLGDPGLGPHENVAIHDVVADPRFPQVLYAATTRGVYRSSDAAATWQPRNEGLGELEVLALTVESADSYARWPIEDAILLAATRGGGIFRSTNSGRRWHPSSRGLSDPYVRALLADPHDPEIVVAGTANGGIFRSEDGGLSWVSSSEGLVEFGVRDLQAEDGDLFAATDLGGVYRSPDLGRTWRRLGTVGVEEPKEAWVSDLGPLGLDPRALSVSAFSVDPDDSEVMVAAAAFGLFTTSDGGGSWEWSGKFLNASDVARDARDPARLAAATSRGLALSDDGGLSWRVEQDPQRRAVVSVRFLEAGEASGMLLAGTDDGRVLRRRQDADRRPLEQVRWPWKAAPPRPLLEPRHDPHKDQPREDDYRRKRARTLARLASAEADELRMEDPRLLALLALESRLRGEELEAYHQGTDLESSLRVIYGHLAQLQRDFVTEQGLEALRFGPDARKLAANFFWDDGVERRSELRVFELDRFLLFETSTLEAVGPSRFWKELHDPHRRPEQVLPTWVAKDPGRLLTWTPDGTSLLTQSSAHAMTLWRLGEGSGLPTSPPIQPEATVLRGLRSPARVAAFSPSARYLAVADSENRVYMVDFENRRGLQPWLGPLPDGVSTLVMTERGLIVLSERGAIRLWLLGERTARRLGEAGKRYGLLDTAPGQSWLLIGEKARAVGNHASPRGWGEMTLLPWAGKSEVFGGGSRWIGREWSTDGRWLAVSRRAATELWRLDAQPTLVLTEKHERSASVRFSPDARRLQVGDTIWLLDEGSPVRELEARRGADHRLLRSATQETRREFWQRFGLKRSPSNRTAMKDLDRKGALPAETSPGGRWLLALGSPWQLHLWHFGNPELGALAPPTGETLTSLRRFHLPASEPSPAEHWPDGVSAGLVNAPVNELFASVCNIAGRNLTEPEWKRFMGDEPYRETCVRSRRR